VAATISAGCGAGGAEVAISVFNPTEIGAPKSAAEVVAVASSTTSTGGSTLAAIAGSTDALDSRAKDSGGVGVVRVSTTKDEAASEDALTADARATSGADVSEKLTEDE